MSYKASLVYLIFLFGRGKTLQSPNKALVRYNMANPKELNSILVSWACKLYEKVYETLLNYLNASYFINEMRKKILVDQS